MNDEVFFGETIIPPEAIYFYMGAFGLAAVVIFSGFIAGLALSGGPRRKLGVQLASTCALLLGLLAIFFVKFFSH